MLDCMREATLRSFRSVATAVHLPPHELHEELQLQPAGGGLAGGPRWATRLPDASSVCDHECSSPYALHSRYQLAVRHSSVHTHHAAREIHVDGLHTLEATDRLNDGCPAVLGTHRLHAQDYLGTLVHHRRTRLKCCTSAADHTSKAGEVLLREITSQCMARSERTQMI